MVSHYGATLRLGLPIAVGQLGVIIMGFADTMMVGRYSTEALAAASFANSVLNLCTFMLMGYSYGLTPLVSAHYGAGRAARAGGVLRRGLVCNVLFALLLVACLAWVYGFLPHMGQPVSLLPLIRPYLLCLALSLPFVAAFNALRQFTDGLTHTAMAMWALLGSNALNVVGNYLLIYGPGPLPELGLTGAGVSTLLSRMVMAAALGAVVLRSRRYAPYRRGYRAASCHLAALRRMHAQSWPIGMQMGMESGAFTFTGIMAGWIGAVDLAAFQVMVTVGTLGFLFYYSFGAGVSIRVAAFMGSQSWQQVHQATRAGVVILLGMACVSSLTFVLGGRWLIGLFTTDAAVLGLCLSLIPPLVLYQLGDAMQICFANALRGTAHVQSMMWIAFVSYVVVNLPMAYVLAFPLGMGSMGLFLAFSAGLFTAALLFARQYYRVVRRLA